MPFSTVMAKKCGDIVAVQIDSNDAVALLAVVRKDDIEAGSLTLGDGSPLTLQPLPYTIEE